jgi:hypothetical protein
MNESELFEPRRVLLLPGVPERLPGAAVELWWKLEDNIPILRRRRPDPPELVLTVRHLSQVDGTTRRRAGQWRTRSNAT